MFFHNFLYQACMVEFRCMPCGKAFMVEKVHAMSKYDRNLPELDVVTMRTRYRVNKVLFAPCMSILAKLLILLKPIKPLK